MTGLIDDRMTKVIAFVVGETYNGRTVEARTACFVTFKGESRKKIAIVDGIEVIDTNRVITAFKEPVVEVAEPNWFQEHQVMLIDARSGNFPCSELPKQRAAKPHHTMKECLELANEIEARIMDDGKYHVIQTPLVKEHRVFMCKRNASALYQELTEIKALIDAQPQEPPVAEVEVLAASQGYQLVKMPKAWQLFQDGLLVGNELSLLAIRDRLEAELYSKRFNVEVPSAIDHVYSVTHGHHVQVVRDVPHCGYEKACPLAVELDEPEWFYDSEFERERLESSLDRDCDRAANFAMSLGGLI